MDWGLIVTLKSGWGKHGSESLLGGFWGFWVEFWDNFFVQTASLKAKIAMVGSNHPFDERMGRLAQKRLVSVPIFLKWWKLLDGRKRGRSAMVDFDN